MKQLSLETDLQQALEDLADATGRTVEGLVEEAVRRYVEGEEGRVLEVAGRLGGAHAGLLEKLGE
ncbi:ribbon-helix-helix domain-containing protein [Streptomyces sp. S6]